jgi:hypothetical protein
MESPSRIPTLSETSFDGALLWFSKMQCASILFNPDDDPADIIVIKTGERLFCDAECIELRKIIDTLDLKLGHDTVIEAAYPIFMNAMGIQLHS